MYLFGLNCPKWMMHWAFGLCNNEYFGLRHRLLLIIIDSTTSSVLKIRGLSTITSNQFSGKPLSYASLPRYGDHELLIDSFLPNSPKYLWYILFKYTIWHFFDRTINFVCHLIIVAIGFRFWFGDKIIRICSVKRIIHLHSATDASGFFFWCDRMYIPVQNN